MKKSVLVLMVLAFSAGLLFAGGAGEKAATTATATAARYPATVDPWAKYPSPVTATFAAVTNSAEKFPQGDSYTQNVWTRSLLEEMNIKMVEKYEATDVKPSQFETKTNLAIVSNDLPDLITLTNADQFRRLVAAGRLEDLTEAYAKFAYPLFKQWFESDGGTRKGWGTVGGKLLGISPSQVNYMSPRMVFIRRDWRQKTGLPVPKTMDEVIAMARAFKAMDPKNRYGLLITKDILENGMSDLQGIANSMGVYPRMWLDDGTGKLVYGSVQPGMKDVLKLYRQLYAEGLINPEFATTSGGDSAEQLTNGKVGIAVNSFWLTSWPLNELYDKDGVEWDAYPLPPMKGYLKDAKVMVQTDNMDLRFFAVRKGYANPEVLVKVLNYEAARLNDPERAQTEKFHSDANYDYQMMAPFYPPFAPLTINLDTNTNVTNAIDRNDTKYLVTAHDKLQYGRVKSYVDAVKAGTKPGSEDWVAYNFFYGPSSAFGVLNYYWSSKLVLTSPAVGIQTNEMARKQDTLNNLELQYYTQIITGQKPLDGFDQWVKDWKDLGGDLISYEINDWYKSSR